MDLTGDVRAGKLTFRFGPTKDIEKVTSGLLVQPHHSIPMEFFDQV